ncbi:hypothetical protein [Streptosporangium canum]|uniref:hypothetical protein n=1 Tax=Streptosporangium canum TaxID=324952 RepID=UPI001160BDB7|nr:hypothetical protein [Streptosporangium canum]
MRSMHKSNAHTAGSLLALAFLTGGALAGCGSEPPREDVSVAAVASAISATPALPMPGISSGAPVAPKIEEPPVDAIPRISSSERIPMPLDPYIISMKDLRTIDIARDIRAAVCMKSLGFTEWTAGTVRTWDPENDKEYDYLEYIDPVAAANSGYPRTQPDPKLLSPKTPAGDKRRPTGEERAAFNGSASQTSTGRAVPEGGCSKEGARGIRDEAIELPVDARALAVNSRISARQDSRVTAALAAWRSCMEKSGLRYPDPVIPRQNPEWASRKADAPAGAEEKRVAGTDATCQREVNLVGVYKTVRAAYEERLVAADREKLAAARPIMEAWVKNAEAVIAAAG